ncbi:GTPase HflX [Acetobacteraceae bacterium]|nr:GTPase HflX [Acetobacteraceae bacterium]
MDNQQDSGLLEEEKDPQNVLVLLPWGQGSVSSPRAQARLEEAVGLAGSINLKIVWQGIFPLRAPKPATLLGSGQVEELREIALAAGAGLVVIDHALTPIQQRNLEKALGAKVIDRTGLILDIFGARAATKEGVLQVELAHLEYQRSRLVRLWTHLERQRGGFGFLGGPGETQMEADRRMIGARIIKIKKELEQVRRTRGLHRQSRERVPFPVIALVGYTNAGKSTLFNCLTGAEVMAKDQLFATLDPTMREVRLPSGRKVILSDTVGFISDLPTELVEAFRATLEEVAFADVILHVRDISAPDTLDQKKDVLGVLEKLEEDKFLDANWRNRVVEVRNKCDLLPEFGLEDETEQESLEQDRDSQGEDSRESAQNLRVSALTGEGCETLLNTLDHVLMANYTVETFTLHPEEGAKWAWLNQNGEILKKEISDEGETALTVRISPADLDRFFSKFPS